MTEDVERIVQALRENPPGWQDGDDRPDLRGRWSNDGTILGGVGLLVIAAVLVGCGQVSVWRRRRG